MLHQSYVEGPFSDIYPDYAVVLMYSLTHGGSFGRTADDKDIGEGGALTMHLIRLDIDRKNSAAHLQVGPLGGGLNAVYAPIAATSSAMARFVRSILFRGNFANETADDDTEGIDGSLQWVDASGHVRMMSYSGGSALLPTRFVHSPMHPSQRPIHAVDREHIRGLGNIFWEGDDEDGRWDDLRGDILGMVFCSQLGSISPEKLWWAASRLGVHQGARSEPDEGYQRLKSEEQELLDRLRNAESVDHDRAWWSIERDRLAAELQHIQNTNANHVALSAAASVKPVAVASPLEERLTAIKVEIARLRGLQQELVFSEANSRPEGMRSSGRMSDRRDDHRLNAGLSNFDVSKSDRSEFAVERQRLQSKIEQLLAEQANVEIQLRQQPQAVAVEGPRLWDDSQVRQQYAHAEEMLRRWDRRAQWHRRLAEVQSHLRTRSPYRRTSEGSLMPMAEKYLRELTAGAVRQLPPWAVEASYLLLQQSYTDSDLNANSYRDSAPYRDEYYDRTVPSAGTRQRKLVDLAIRLAIAQASLPRIGRIPMLLDNSLSGFRGDALEQILHVLATAARDGRQILIATDDEFVARRVSAHGGTVSRLHEVLRYAQPRFVMDSETELGVSPLLESAPSLGPTYDAPGLRVVGGVERNHEIGEINRHLTGLANEQAQQSWWQGMRPVSAPAFVPVAELKPIAAANRKHFLTFDSPVSEIPGVDADLVARLQRVGLYRTGDLLNADYMRVSNATRIDAAYVQYLQSIADLMCATPQLRAFDARVLVGCGISRAGMLKELSPSQLVDRVEAFLSTPAGLSLTHSASSFELARIHQWIASVRNSAQRTRNHVEDAELAIDVERSRRERKVVRRPVVSKSTPVVTAQWKFYLDIDSPVVDAPSIGPRMAERLSPLNINTVGELIAADAESIVDGLADRAVNADTIRSWQSQALLVCRIPNLRGHDAQLLVASGYTTAEEVASADANELFAAVVKTASSKAGQRILRGSNAPDRAEVDEWISWAQNCRAVRAA